jgi:hypothetical protein
MNSMNSSMKGHQTYENINIQDQIDNELDHDLVA